MIFTTKRQGLSMKLRNVLSEVLRISRFCAVLEKNQVSTSEKEMIQERAIGCQNRAGLLHRVSGKRVTPIVP